MVSVADSAINLSFIAVLMLSSGVLPYVVQYNCLYAL